MEPLTVTRHEQFDCTTTTQPAPSSDRYGTTQNGLFQPWTVSNVLPCDSGSVNSDITNHTSTQMSRDDKSTSFVNSYIPILPKPSVEKVLQEDYKQSNVPFSLYDNGINNTATLPPISVSVGVLNVKFMEIENKYKTKTQELHNFYKLQSANIESERYQTINKNSFAVWLHGPINAYYDTQHRQLIDRIEQSLRLLDTTKAIKKVTAKKNKAEKVKRKLVTLNPLAIRIMENWYKRNSEHPYPSNDTCEILSKGGSITVEQVKKWFANKRMRSGNTKKLCEIARRRKRPLDVSAMMMSSDSKRMRDSL